MAKIFTSRSEDCLIPARAGRVPQQGKGMIFAISIFLNNIFQINRRADNLKSNPEKSAKNISLPEAQLKAILQSMREGVIAINEKRRIILLNSAVEKIFGIKEQEVLGLTIREAVRNNAISDIAENTLVECGTLEEEINIFLPKEYSFMAQASPIFGLNSSVLGAVCVLYDMTNIKRLEKLRSEFVANVSHELKTPLTAILSSTETLLAGAINDQEHNMEFLGKIKKHAQNLSALIDDILQLSKLEAKKESARFGEISLKNIILKAIETVSQKAEGKDIQINFSKDNQDLHISGIEEYIYRALLNILDNAINYSPKGSYVAISTIKRDDKIEISISDKGIGMPKDAIPHIFERFYRVDSGRSKDLGGTGLGLSIVKHIVDLHKGTIHVNSELGRGSAFTIILPYSNRS